MKVYYPYTPYHVPALCFMIMTFAILIITYQPSGSSMDTVVKKTKIALFLLSILGLSACHHTTINKNKKNEITSPSAILDVAFHNSLIIPVTIKNKTYPFLVDTGSSVSIINKKISSDISTPYLYSELPASYQKTLASIHTANGSVKNNLYTFLKPTPYYIGNQEINDEEVWLSMDLSLLKQALGIDIDGIIGIPSFRKFSWQVDNLKHRLVISEDAPSSLAYQQCHGYNDKQNSMPEMWFNYYDADIAFMIDTGADHSSISSDFVGYLKDKHPEDLQPSDTGAILDANGLSTDSSSILYKLIFNGLPLGEVIVSENKSQQFTMGMNFLSRFDRYAFIPSRMMFCYDATTIEKKGIVPVRSLAIRYINQHIEIFYNDDTVLAESGLMNGDIILKANDKNYLPEQIDDLRKVLSETSKGALKLTIERHKKPLEIIL